MCLFYSPLEQQFGLEKQLICSATVSALLSKNWSGHRQFPSIGSEQISSDIYRDVSTRPQGEKVLKIVLANKMHCFSK